jgi:trans-aconitate methyltransferase
MSIYATLSLMGETGEAEPLRHLLERYAQRPVRDLLDMACGTGLHDQYLKDHYHVEGADLSPSQLAIARRRCPDLVFHEADMTDFDLARTVTVPAPGDCL